MPQITVEIDAQGNTSVAASGVSGSSCKELTRQIEQAIGSTVDDVKKPEFHRPAGQANQQNNQHGGQA